MEKHIPFDQIDPWADEIEAIYREQWRCDDCLVHYQHGGPSPWTCPRCQTVWRVRDREWVLA